MNTEVISKPFMQNRENFYIFYYQQPIKMAAELHNSKNTRPVDDTRF